MPGLKDKVINGIIAVEGGYSNDKSDSGGETNYGVTVAVARANGYAGAMKDMPRELAFNIYAKKYWDALYLDSIEKVSAGLAEELADTGVNMGVGTAAVFLQRALNCLNNGGEWYADIPVDGVLGQGTVNALLKFLARRGAVGEKVLLRMMNSLQGAKYISLCENRAKDEKYVYGWFLNRVS